MSTTPIESKNPQSSNSPDWSSIETKVRKHLVWKEGRLLLPACIGMLALVALVMIATGLTQAQTLTANAGGFITLALGGASMAALVCGSVTFSMERENQTDDFLARLPLAGKKLGRVKIATATIYFLGSYVIAMLMAVGLFALFFGGQSLIHQIGSRAVLGATAPIAFLLPGVCLLWSMLFSRYMQTTLSTVLLAACCTLLVPALLAGASEAITYWSGMSHWLGPWLFLALFLTQMVLLVYAIGRQHGSWLRPSSVAAHGTAAGTTEVAGQLAIPKAGFVTSAKSLIWQTFRFHWLGSLIALLVCGLYLTGMLSIISTLLIAVPYAVSSLSIEFANDMFAALIGGVTGLLLFSKDQAGKSFHFFQQRADYPRRIWFARIINLIVIGMAVIISIFIINLVLYSSLTSFSESFKITKVIGNSDIGHYSNFHDLNFHRPMKGTEWSYYLWLTLRSATMFFVVASLGQLVSIFCRHGILNALLGIVFCSMATIWVRYVNWYQVPVWSLAWPIGIAAFAMSWSYAPSWIRGTRQIRWSLASTLVMVGVCGACILGMRQDRLNDYPVQPAFADLDELYENPEKLKANGDPRFEVARELDAAVSKIDLAWSKIIDQGKGSKATPDTPRKFTKTELQLAQDKQDAFATVAKLVQAPAARYYFYQSPDAADQISYKKHDTIQKCLKLYQAATVELGEPERVRSALFAKLAFAAHNDSFYSPTPIADLLNWADNEDRTLEEVLPLVDQVEVLIQAKFSPDNLDWLESNYSYVRSELSSREEKRLLSHSYADLPWESERMKRQQQYKLLKKWNQDQKNREKQFGAPEKIQLRLIGGTFRPVEAFTAPMRDTLDFGYLIRREQEFLSQEWLRYAQVRLALAAWRCDNQGYPEKLTELNPDYLASTFPTYYLKEAFSYHPDGLNLPVVLSADLFSQRANSRAEQVRSVIPAKTPFLLPWTALPTEQRYFQIKVPDEQDETKFSTTDPELGYFMGQDWNKNNRSFIGNGHPEVFVFGRGKSAAQDSDE